MTSAVLGLGPGFASKIEEKALPEDSCGMGVVTDMGLCVEKKDAT